MTPPKLAACLKALTRAQHDVAGCVLMVKTQQLLPPEEVDRALAGQSLVYLRQQRERAVAELDRAIRFYLEAWELEESN